MINGATCNATNTGGCDQTPAIVPVGWGALLAAINPETQQVITTNLQDASISVINGTHCNAANTRGCSHAPAAHAVGNYPAFIALDPSIDTAYVSNNYNVSVVPIKP